METLLKQAQIFIIILAGHFNHNIEALIKHSQSNMMMNLVTEMINIM